MLPLLPLCLMWLVSGYLIRCVPSGCPSKGFAVRFIVNRQTLNLGRLSLPPHRFTKSLPVEILRIDQQPVAHPSLFVSRRGCVQAAINARRLHIQHMIYKGLTYELRARHFPPFHFIQPKAPRGTTLASTLKAP